jgi:membrane glycosyltransferase
LAAPLAALWFARVFPGGLVAIRILWPALALGLAFTQWLAPAMVSLLGGVVIGVLAWHPTVAVAFHPPRERGTVYPIPPELAPREVLDSADLDERGRPLR